MLDKLERLPPDPILGLAAAARADDNPDKVDLTVGIYMDEQGVCPVFNAVSKAQLALEQEEITKAYMPAPGAPEFNTGIPGDMVRTTIDVVEFFPMCCIPRTFRQGGRV